MASGTDPLSDGPPAGERVAWSGCRDDKQRNLKALREAIGVGDASGESLPADRVFAELRQMIAKRRAEPR